MVECVEMITRGPMEKSSKGHNGIKHRMMALSEIGSPQDLRLFGRLSDEKP